MKDNGSVMDVKKMNFPKNIVEKKYNSLKPDKTPEKSNPAGKNKMIIPKPKQSTILPCSFEKKQIHSMIICLIDSKCKSGFKSAFEEI